MNIQILLSYEYYLSVYSFRKKKDKFADSGNTSLAYDIITIIQWIFAFIVYISCLIEQYPITISKIDDQGLNISNKE